MSNSVEKLKMPISWVVILITAVVGYSIAGTSFYLSIKWSQEALHKDIRTLRSEIRQETISRDEMSDWRNELAENNHNLIVPKVPKAPPKRESSRTEGDIRAAVIPSRREDKHNAYE